MIVVVEQGASAPIALTAGGPLGMSLDSHHLLHHHHHHQQQMTTAAAAHHHHLHHHHHLGIGGMVIHFTFIFIFILDKIQL